MDADFDLLDEIPVSSLNVMRGDCHDLEALLVRSPALDRVLREFGSAGKMQRFVSKAGRDIRMVWHQDVIEIAEDAFAHLIYPSDRV